MSAFARLILILLYLTPQVAVSDDAGHANLKSILDYVSGLAADGESLRAIIVYDLLLHTFSGAGKNANVAIVCEELVANVAASDVKHFNRSLWKCSDDLLSGWYADLEQHRSIGASATAWFAPRLDTDLEQTETIILLCDVSPRGRASNVRVVSSTNPELNMPTIKAIERWWFTPALFQGVAIWELDREFKFV